MKQSCNTCHRALDKFGRKYPPKFVIEYINFSLMVI